MKPINSAAHNAEALVDLLENILVSYQDSDSRPEQSLMLYRKWLQLDAKYRVRLAKGQSSSKAAHDSNYRRVDGVGAVLPKRT